MCVCVHAHVRAPLCTRASVPGGVCLQRNRWLLLPRSLGFQLCDPPSLLPHLFSPQLGDVCNTAAGALAVVHLCFYPQPYLSWGSRHNCPPSLNTSHTAPFHGVPSSSPTSPAFRVTLNPLFLSEPLPCLGSSPYSFAPPADWAHSMSCSCRFLEGFQESMRLDQGLESSQGVVLSMCAAPEPCPVPGT